MYRIFLCVRYLMRKWIAFFAVGAVTLCTAMVLIVISVMGGFLDMVKERSRGLLADLIVDNYTLQGFPFYQEFIDQIHRDMPDMVEAATPVVYNYGTLRFADGITKPVYLVGIRLEETFETNEFRQSLYYEHYYPGSTSLAEQQQPAFGFDDQLKPALPPDLEKSLAKARAADETLKVKERDPLFSFERERGSRFEGPGIHESPVFSALYWLERLNADLESFAGDVAFQLNRTSAQSELDPILGQLPELHKVINRIRSRIEPANLPDKVVEPLSHLESSLTDLAKALQRGDTEWVARLMDLIQTSAEYQISVFREHLGPRYVGAKLPGVVIGRDMIGKPLEGSEYERYYARGERVIITMLPFSRKGTIAPTGSISKAMRYVDDSRYGIFEIDSRNVYFDFNMAQEYLGMGPQRLDEALGGGMSPPRATQIQIKLAEGVDLSEGARHMQRAWIKFTERIGREMPLGTTDDDLMLMSACSVETWKDRQRQYIAAVEKEKVLVTILFAIISVVAVCLVGVIFYMIVQQKTRDIGIIKSLGATSAGVASIFIGYGFLVGVLGALLGVAIGCAFVHYINEIQEWLAAFNPELRVWSRETYIFDHIPNTVNTHEAAVIFFVAIIASTIGSLIPAWRAAKVWPVESLRYE